MPVIRIAKSIVKRILRRPTDQGAQTSAYSTPQSTYQAPKAPPPKAAPPEVSPKKEAEAPKPAPVEAVEPEKAEASEAAVEKAEAPQPSETPAEEAEAPPAEESAPSEPENNDAEESDSSVQDDAAQDGATYVFSASGLIPEECPSCGAASHNNWLRDGQDFVCGSCEEPFA